MFHYFLDRQYIWLLRCDCVSEQSCPISIALYSLYTNGQDFLDILYEYIFLVNDLHINNLIVSLMVKWARYCMSKKSCPFLKYSSHVSWKRILGHTSKCTIISTALYRTV